MKLFWIWTHLCPGKDYRADLIIFCTWTHRPYMNSAKYHQNWTISNYGHKRVNYTIFMWGAGKAELLHKSLPMPPFYWWNCKQYYAKNISSYLIRGSWVQARFSVHIWRREAKLLRAPMDHSMWYSQTIMVNSSHSPFYAEANWPHLLQ